MEQGSAALVAFTSLGTGRQSCTLSRSDPRTLSPLAQNCAAQRTWQHTRIRRTSATRRNEVQARHARGSEPRRPSIKHCPVDRSATGRVAAHTQIYC
jgi:hypothetical protein